MAVCDNPAASPMALSVAPSACMARMASSLRNVASRALRAQEATSLAVTSPSGVGPSTFPVLRGTTPACPRRRGTPAGPGPSPALLRHVGDVLGGVLHCHALEGKAVAVATGADDGEAGKGPSLGGGDCGDGGGVLHGDLPVGCGVVGCGHEQSKPCFHNDVNIVSKEICGMCGGNGYAEDVHDPAFSPEPCDWCGGTGYEPAGVDGESDHESVDPSAPALIDGHDS